jgi:hypothetical protein
LNNVVEGSNGLLYGSIYGLGGAPNEDLARIYSIAKTGGSLQILYQASRSDGFASNTLIQGKDGALYGTARDGAPFGTRRDALQLATAEPCIGSM